MFIFTDLVSLSVCEYASVYLFYGSTGLTTVRNFVLTVQLHQAKISVVFVFCSYTLTKGI